MTRNTYHLGMLSEDVPPCIQAGLTTVLEVNFAVIKRVNCDLKIPTQQTVTHHRFNMEYKGALTTGTYCRDGVHS